MFILLSVVLIGFASAEPCNLRSELINQDPRPAMPGEYVELVFQLTGVENYECGKVQFELVEGYPFSLDNGAKKKFEIVGGIFSSGFNSFLLAPYKVRVDKDALDGESEIEVSYYNDKIENFVTVSQKFNVSIEDVRTDFEISVKDYEYSTNTINFEILNTGEHDAEGLVVEIPKQENIDVKGSNKYIAGSLDANEDTSFSFEVIPKNGEIKLNIIYTDEINERRILEKSINFDSSYFWGRKKDEVVAKPISYYVAIGEFVLFVLIWLFSWLRRRRRRKNQLKYMKK